MGMWMLKFRREVSTGTCLGLWPGLGPVGQAGRRGDLVLILQLVVPDRLDQDQRAILEQWIGSNPIL